MKSRILSVLGFALMVCFSSQSKAQIILNINDDLVVTNPPRLQTSINYEVSELKSECVQIYGSNPGKSAVALGEGENRMDPGQEASVVCMAKLTEVVPAGDGRRYVFSPACAENNKSSANVRVVFGNGTVSQPNAQGDQTGFIMTMANDAILNVDSNSTPEGATRTEEFLHVIASPSNKAQVSINLDDNRGQCFIAIVTSGSEGNTLAILDPKSETNRSFTVDQSVFVIPIVRATEISENGRQVLLYDIGDPVRNGKVVVREL